MKKNTPELWNQYWKSPLSIEKAIYTLLYEENNISWQRIKQVILAHFFSFKGLKVVEIGAGQGTISALMALNGADVTILDYSEAALNRYYELFMYNGLSALFLKQDVFRLPESMLNKYDIAMSFGFAEHFEGPDRIRVIKAHFDLIKQGGLSIIAVPNKYNLPYRIFKFVAELLKHWPVGEEYPFSRKELSNICYKNRIQDYVIFGDSMLSSFCFINPLKRSFVRRALHLRNNYKVPRLRKQKGSFLDQYLGYNLILCAKK